MVRAVFWQQTDLPPGSNMLRLAYADSGSACKLAGVQISLLPMLANQILARTFFRSVANLFACPAVGKFSRASSAGDRRHLQLNFVNQIVSVAEDCLSPERTFHGCQQNAARIRGYIRGWFRRESVCVPSRWKVLSGEFRRRPTELAIKFRKSDRVGRRGLPEPREDFSRLPTKCFSNPWLYP